MHIVCPHKRPGARLHTPGLQWGYWSVLSPLLRGVDGIKLNLNWEAAIALTEETKGLKQQTNKCLNPLTYMLFLETTNLLIIGLLNKLINYLLGEPSKLKSDETWEKFPTGWGSSHFQKFPSF